MNRAFLLIEVCNDRFPKERAVADGNSRSVGPAALESQRWKAQR